MNWFKPGQKVHRIAQAASVGWWRRKRRFPRLSGPLGWFRLRSKPFAQKVEGAVTPRGGGHDTPTMRRAVVTDPKWGLRVRAWLTGLTERLLLLAVESLLILRSVFGFWQDLWLGGRELVSRRLSPGPDIFASFTEDLLRGRLQNGCRTQGRAGQWGERAETGPLERDDLPTPQRATLREEVEYAKISDLFSEEEELPEEELVDQAGALRSRLASVGHREWE